MGVVVAIAAAQRAQRASQGQALKKQQTLAKHLSQDIQVAPKSGPSFHQTFSPARSPAHTRMPPMNTSVVFTDEHPGDEPFHKLYLLKVFMKKLYTSRASEVTFAALIMGNFVANAAEAQVAAGDTADNIFNVFEIFFGAAFTFELVLNMIGHWWREFWRSAWNWFDALVVVVSILNVSGGGLPGLGTLRILRAFRVVRLFKRAGSLKKIILAIGEALPGVMNAFAILMMVMCLYAILAVDLFGAQEENKQMFGKFSTALFTMFQMMTTEGWADIARDVMATSGDGYAVFFVSFILIANILLANVVIAVLIEKVIAFQDDESDSGDPDMMADFPHIPAHFWNGNEAENIDLSSAASTDSSLVPNNSMPHRTVNTMSKRQYSVKDSLRDLENEEDVRGGRIHVPALDDTGLRPNYSKEQQSFNEGLSTNTDLGAYKCGGGVLWQRLKARKVGIGRSVGSSVCSSFHPYLGQSICPSVNVFVNPSECSFVRPSICLSIHPNVRLSSICPSVCQSICLSIRPSMPVNPSGCPSICLLVRPFVCPFVSPSIRPSICLSIHPNVCPYVNLSVNPSDRPVVLSMSVRMSVNPSICPFVRPSVRPSIRPSIFLSIHPNDRQYVR